MNATAFRRMFEVLHNLELADLALAGVIGPTGDYVQKEWQRFNCDLTTFVLKLPADRLEKLVALVEKSK